jgi:hypothetical protein
MRDEKNRFINSSLAPSYTFLRLFKDSELLRVHPFALILHPCFSVSAQKLMNVPIVRFP